jgi:mannose-1-phosphate guanylyltransferase/mannose-6-phosphate isomerase
VATRIIPVIMSGGSGTRLWPLSTDARPKQFHALGASRTLIEETASRLRGVHGDLEFLPPVVIAGEGHRDLVAETLSASGITPAAVILEPMGRNTAATAALAATVASSIDPDALVLLTPADHLVADPAAFLAAIKAGAAIARDHIVTFGIAPDRPETGYGYIRRGDQLADGVFAVAAFEEKPQLETAERYLREGGFSWNSGVFFFHPDVMLDEFAAAGAADIREGASAALARGRRNGSEVKLDRALFGAVRAEPIDIAVMQKTKRAAVVPCDIGWADVGSWSELWRLSKQDGQGNATMGSVTLVDGANNLVRAEGVHVSAVGVEDLIIVATKEAVLILPRHRAQEVKSLIPKKPG